MITHVEATSKQGSHEGAWGTRRGGSAAWGKRAAHVGNHPAEEWQLSGGSAHIRGPQGAEHSSTAGHCHG